ncbi:MAG TPA: hypothetical protein PLY70_11590, partial [Saprospiraceae bacterium]|nr:hypothetical protein [Saprospiraceae bacterium]
MIKKGLVLIVAFLLCINLFAATFNVNTTNDTHAVTPLAGTGLDASGNISFRSAIEAANAVGGNHTINVPAGTYNLTLGMIIMFDRVQNITIIGVSPANTIINMTNTLQDRILLIGDSGTQANMVTSISNMTFQNG